MPYFPPANYPLFDATVFAPDQLPPPPPLPLPTYEQQLLDQFYEAASVYDATHYALAQPNPSPYQLTQPAHIHAPIPISAYSTLLPHVHHASSAASPPPPPTVPPLAPSQRRVELPHDSAPYVIKISPAPEQAGQQPVASRVDDGTDEKPHDTLLQYDVPQVMFPTPGELLADMTKKEQDVGTVPSPARWSPEASSPTVAGSPLRRSPTPKGASRKSKSRPKAKVPAVLQPVEPGRTENLRKSYFRSVADQVGFQPTDP